MVSLSITEKSLLLPYSLPSDVHINKIPLGLLFSQLNTPLQQLLQSLLHPSLLTSTISCTLQPQSQKFNTYNQYQLQNQFLTCRIHPPLLNVCIVFAVGWVCFCLLLCYHSSHQGTSREQGGALLVAAPQAVRGLFVYRCCFVGLFFIFYIVHPSFVLSSFTQ